MNKITEKHNNSSINIDSLDTIDILKIINQEDSTIHKQIKNDLLNIERIISVIIVCLKHFRDGFRFWLDGYPVVG